MRTLRLAALLPLFLAPLAIADEAPKYVLSHAGRLVVGDQPVNGPTKLTFRIWQQPIASPFGNETPLWTASYNVPIVKGEYALALGETPTLTGTGLTKEALGGGAARWMSIEIEAVGELTPRMRIGTVPRSNFADEAGDVVCAGCIDTTKLKDGAVTLAKIAPGTITANLLATNQSGTVAGLSADTLDGFDSSAFAPSEKVTEVKAVVDGIASTTTTILEKTNALPADIGALKGDIASVKADVATVKTNVGDVKTDVGAVKTDVGAVKLDVAGVAAKVTNAPDVWTKVQALETKVNGLETKLTAMDAKLTSLTDILVGRTTCPGDMVLVGAAGGRASFCIEKDEKGATQYNLANKACFLNGRRMCTQDEWTTACGATGLNGMIGSQYEWVDFKGYVGTSGYQASTGIGNGGTCDIPGITYHYIGYGGWHAGYNYRCCL